MTLMAPGFTFGEIGGFFYGLRRTGFRKTIMAKAGTPQGPPLGRASFFPEAGTRDKLGRSLDPSWSNPYDG
ncbi:MAG: hypothetical protein WA228_10210 [Desulfobaccales bacterium]